MVSSTMVLLTVRMDLLTKEIKYPGLECKGNIIIYFWYIMFLPFLSMTVVWIITSYERERKMLQNVLEFSINVTSYCVYVMRICLFELKLDGYSLMWPLIFTTMCIFWSILVGARCHQDLDISTQLSWKGYLINVIVGIIWVPMASSVVFFGASRKNYIH